jgi:hypothetical protein
MLGRTSVKERKEDEGFKQRLSTIPLGAFALEYRRPAEKKENEMIFFFFFLCSI